MRELENKIKQQQKNIEMMESFESFEVYEELIRKKNAEIDELKKQYSLITKSNNEIKRLLSQVLREEKKAQALLSEDKPENIDEMLKRIGRITINGTISKISLKVTDEVNNLLEQIEKLIAGDAQGIVS